MKEEFTAQARRPHGSTGALGAEFFSAAHPELEGRVLGASAAGLQNIRAYLVN
jgi:hypothetical protein